MYRSLSERMPIGPARSAVRFAGMRLWYTVVPSARTVRVRVPSHRASGGHGGLAAEWISRIRWQGNDRVWPLLGRSPCPRAPRTPYCDSS